MVYIQVIRLHLVGLNERILAMYDRVNHKSEVVLVSILLIGLAVIVILIYAVVGGVFEFWGGVKRIISDEKRAERAKIDKAP